MKHVLTGISLLALVAIVGCKDKKASEEAQVNEEMKMEIEEMDAANAQIDSVQQAIESASKDLDELLNELEE